MSTYSSNLKIELIGTGEQAGVWGTTTNSNFSNVFEQSIVGRVTVTFANADVTLSANNTVASQDFRNLYLNCSGTNSAAKNLIVPTINKNYVVENNTTGGFDITVKTSAGTGVTVPNGMKCAVYVDGTDVVQASDFFPAVKTNQVNLLAQGDLRFEDASGGQYAALQAPATIASSYTLTLPVDDGASGQRLITDGSGVLSFSTARINSVTSSASITPNADTTDQYEVTALATSTAINAPSGTPLDGQKLIIRILDNGSPQNITWTTTSGGYRVVGSVLPTTTVSNKVSYIGCIWNSQASYWDVVAVANET